MTGKPNHWLLIGRAGTGKSTFAAKMPLEHLVLDFDGRWYEQEASTRHHVVSNASAWEIVQQVEHLRPTLKGKIGTVIVDSGTTLLDYEQSLDRLANAGRGDKGWQNEAFKRKADIMRTLSGAILRWICSSLWIFHIEDSRDRGTAKIRQTIPNAELERLKKHLNAILEMSANGGKREIKVVWCRYNDGAAVGQVVRDTHLWGGVHERLDVFLREFKGNEGYNGNAYSLEWLKEFLQTKGIIYYSIEEMRSKLGIEEVPLWFDRSAWGQFIKRAGAE